MSLTEKELKQRHVELHQSLDELFACYITEHPEQHRFLDMPFSMLLDWAYEMTLNPTCTDKHKDK